MTKEEIKKLLDNTKVYVNGKSKEIQEKLFSFGYKWGGMATEIQIQHMQEPFLYIGNSLGSLLFYSNNMIEFMNDKRKEIKADEILSIEITEPSYRQFKNRDECWREMQNHQPFGWLYHKERNAYKLISDEIDDTTGFRYFFNLYTFADGTPFGIKEEQL